MSKISVVIPVYNAEQYIQNCLDSVSAQSFSDLEIICVDDCGSDNSMIIVEEYQKKDKRITIVRHKENRGPGPARNSGMEIVKSDYIFFLDSDDYLEPDILQKCFDNITETNADVLLTRTRVYGETAYNEFMNKRVEEVKNCLNFKSFATYNVTLQSFLFSLRFLPRVAWGKLYRRQFLRKKGITFIDRNVVHGDDGFHIKLLCCLPRISEIDEIGVNYLIRSKSLTYELEQKDKENREDLEIVLSDSLSFIKHHRYNSEYFIRRVIASYCKYLDLLSYYYGDGERVARRPKSPKRIIEIQDRIVHHWRCGVWRAPEDEGKDCQDADAFDSTGGDRS